MTGNLKKMIVVGAFVGMSAAGIGIVTLRAARTDMDPAVAELQERLTCPQCRHQFVMTISQVVAMRRLRGDIVCPACGAKGATKDDALASTDLVRQIPSTDQDSDDDQDTAKANQRAKKKTLAGTLSRDDPPK